MEVTHHSLPSLSMRESVASCSLSRLGADDRWTDSPKREWQLLKLSYSCSFHHYSHSDFCCAAESGLGLQRRHAALLVQVPWRPPSVPQGKILSLP